MSADTREEVLMNGSWLSRMSPVPFQHFRQFLVLNQTLFLECSYVTYEWTEIWTWQTQSSGQFCCVFLHLSLIGGSVVVSCVTLVLYVALLERMVTQTGNECWDMTGPWIIPFFEEMGHIKHTQCVKMLPKRTSEETYSLPCPLTHSYMPRIQTTLRI